MLKPMLLALSLSLLAQAEAPRQLEVHTDFPAQLSYRPLDQPNFTPLPNPPALRSTIQIPRSQVIIRAVDSSGWWVLRSAEQTATTIQDSITLSLKPSYRWEHILPLTLISTALLTWWARRSQSRRHQQELHDQEPLIRSDGLVPNRSLAGYQLKKLLGSGAMGVVYLAENRRGERCAIKVPLPNLVAQPDFQDRFQRELINGIKLQHPRVVRLMSYPVTNEPYLMMEYVDGQSLDQVPILTPQEELPRCWQWCDQVLEALEYVHSQQVIHRDLKPANLMLLKDGSLKLMDFGIAHNSDLTRLTASGSVLGTPVFMAPEQIQGAPCDPSIDVYALGILLYERLAGKLPFPTDCMELLVYKIRGQLPSIQGLPPGWGDFIDALVAHNPKARPTPRRAREWLRRLPRQF